MQFTYTRRLNMKRFRLITALLLSLMMALTLCACGGGSSTAEDTSEESYPILVADFFGCWKYDTEDLYIFIYDDGSYCSCASYASEPEDYYWNTYEMGEDCLILLDDNGDDGNYLSFTAEDTLMDADGLYLHRENLDDTGDSGNLRQFNHPDVSESGDYGLCYYWVDTVGDLWFWNGAYDEYIGSDYDYGDYGDEFYWYDVNGDVWYWNGYEDTYVGGGEDYFVDDDGNFFESNDYAWGNDTDNEWSDPGDTGDYDDEDEYESNDYK